jgi:hypothetical protein
MEVKKLTDVCYLISDTYGNKLGLGMVRDDVILFTHDLTFYKSFEEIADKFDEKLIYTELTTTDSAKKEIHEYPIKHDVCFEEEHETHDDFTTYTYKTREGSNVKFCAGWWVIHTDATYRMVISPKLTTLNPNCHGPFKNKFDCQAEVARLNKIKREENE